MQLSRPREPATPCSGFLARCHHTTAWTAFPLISTLQVSRQMQLCNSFALGKSKRKLQKDSKFSLCSPPCPPFDTLTLWHSHLILCNRQTSQVYPFILWIKGIFCLLSLLPSRELFLAFRFKFHTNYVNQAEALKVTSSHIRITKTLQFIRSNTGFIFRWFGWLRICG